MGRVQDHRETPLPSTAGHGPRLREVCRYVGYCGRCAGQGIWVLCERSGLAQKAACLPGSLLPLGGTVLG